MSTSKGNGGRRGHSAGSRRTQFTSSNQPHRGRRRRRERKPPPPDTVLGIVRDAVFQLVQTTRNGRSHKTPAIEALMQLIMKNVFAAPLREQLSFMADIERWGVFDAEEYRREIEAQIYAEFEPLIANQERVNAFVEQQAEVLHSFLLNHMLVDMAHFHAILSCTCGGARHGLELAAVELRHYVAAGEDVDAVDDEAVEADLEKLRATWK